MRWKKEIPVYPEKIGDYGELEQFLLDLDQKEAPRYEDLPEAINGRVNNARKLVRNRKP